MRVQKRGARGFEPVHFDKITTRIQSLCNGLKVIPEKVSQQTISMLFDGITTEELDIISAKIADSYKLIHPDYAILASRILISNLHKTTPKRFSETSAMIKKYLPKIASVKHHNFIEKYARELDNMIIDSNDYLFDYIGFKTLENGYLVKIYEDSTGPDGKPIYVDKDGNLATNVYFTPAGNALMSSENSLPQPVFTKKITRIIDRPQYMFMRVAIAIYIDSSENALNAIKNCYKMLSLKYFTHATPGLFNSCTNHQQLNSCFLLGTADSIEEINRCLSNSSIISKWAGGIGIHMSNIRSRGSLIEGTNGESSGLPQQLKIYNEAALAWNQGGKRKGAWAIYLEPWQGDFMQVMQLKLQQGAETERTRDLFYAAWIPDLFMERVNSDSYWSFFSEKTAPGLSDVYDGMEVCTKCNFCANKNYQIIESGQSECNHTFAPKNVFTNLYVSYENEGRAVKTIKARKVLDAIFDAQRDSGMPYIMFKDHINRQTNQQNIGTIKGSNLCAEITEYSDKDSYACCTLASVNLKKFITTVGNNEYEIDHKSLHDVVRLMARNLDIIIDVNDYPVIECKNNAQDYRPIGIGVQGLADVFMKMRIPFLSQEATVIDLSIFETIYHAALTESTERAVKYGPYKAFAGSPASTGLLRFDLWKKNQTRINSPLTHNIFNLLSDGTPRYNWDAMRELIKVQGLRNSLLVALMPTVSTAQILGNNESFEPIPANIMTKTTLAGKLTWVNTELIKHLIDLGVYTEDMKNKIQADDGSIQNIAEISSDVKEIYKTVWEMKQLDIITRSALRSAFIDQSQSLNIYLNNNENKYLRAIISKSYQLGLTTGSYYIRTRAGAKAFNTNATFNTAIKVQPKCEEGCTTCSL
jgi:ribonucleoside-diphosphate reductase alpha chain